ncbi:hypothetical protein [Streptomyces longwoodensis]|uniref:hypothetical protein n=1 Tax=Streptomyces longwoodensis TaxID=68231 RepID=UPI00225B185E|nr:hypothetical protein [Streptomyces longwoodensis]MCX4994273.1 hypothetical protein [Streptomyces longwoodensis]
MRTRATITALTAAALLALTACSSSDDDAAPASDSGTPKAEPTVSVPAAHQADDVKAAVAVYTAAYFQADVDTAYGMLSARCAKAVDRAGYAAELKEAKSTYGIDHPATDVQAEVSGRLARVSYGVKGLPALAQQAQVWALEGDAWKYDAC